MRLQVDGEAANPQLKLETGDGQVLESQAAWDELEARLGAAVPAGNLRFWMLGLAAPGEHRWQPPDAQGVTRLEQDGWSIDYQQYSDEPGLRVPSRIRAKQWRGQRAHRRRSLAAPMKQTASANSPSPGRRERARGEGS